ncbi:thiamine phosphate synthase [Ehrlichia canis]|uniref:thiamine phosphate synthase n=1 Tax=Ehrlichia canis TaxID=944 RepID=UPI000C855F4F|nr:thiamine phosphate synthase [Ehrlichia canis]AUO54979.1 thiamine phosphate synthase [Ehrlichia canis]UKC53266.1 thiE [Ehrlichia canis]UKC54203.1 thiE [Ehrlichia canis]UKC55139.1 thiE [Ehrlichia canis]
MFECNEIYIIGKDDLVQYSHTSQLRNLDDIIKSVSLLYSIKKKSIYAIDVTDRSNNKCLDYYFNGQEGLWISYKSEPYNDNAKFLLEYKKACTLESKCLNPLDFQKDTLVIARACTNQSVESTSFLDEKCFPNIMIDKDTRFEKNFPAIIDPIRFYQIVPDLYWLRYVINLGVKVVQLRIKDKPIENIENQIKEGVCLANQSNIKLFINDYWQLAIKYKAYGVHLGQKDLKDANFNEIFNAGLRLGISTHCYHELAIARYLRPSYIAFGPIFTTTLKNMDFMPQGVDLLSYWVKNLRSSIIAIGGINLLNVDSVIKTGVNGVAVVSAVLSNNNPAEATYEFIQKCGSIY